MQLLKWNADLELGVEKIDNHHKKLISLINELTIDVEYAQPNSALLLIVDRLQDYADMHFKAEEEIFAERNYTDRASHEAEHAEFLKTIKYIRRQCELIDIPMASTIRDYLYGWLCHHIKTKDMEYKKLIDSSGAH